MRQTQQCQKHNNNLWFACSMEAAGTLSELGISLTAPLQWNLFSSSFFLVISSWRLTKNQLEYWIQVVCIYMYIQLRLLAYLYCRQVQKQKRLILRVTAASGAASCCVPFIYKKLSVSFYFRDALKEGPYFLSSSQPLVSD